MAKRRLVRKRFNAFAGESKDTPPSGNKASFESFENLVPTAISDSNTTEAVSPVGYAMLNYVPLQEDPDAGATGTGANTFNLVMLKFPGVSGNVMCAVHNGDGDSGSNGIGVGRHGEILGLYQELWEQPEISVLSRNIETLADPVEPVDPPAIITVVMDTDSGGVKVVDVDSETYAITETGDSVTGVAGFPLCPDVQGNLWFATVATGFTGFTIYKVDTEGAVSSVGTISKDIADDLWTLYATANRDADGIYILAARREATFAATLYTADSSITEVKASVTLSSSHEYPRGLELNPDGYLIFLTSYDTGAGAYGDFLNAITTAGEVVSGYPKRIDTNRTYEISSSTAVPSGCLCASSTTLYYAESDCVRSVLFADLATSDSTTAIGGAVSDSGMTTYNANIAFAIDPDSGDMIVSGVGAESTGIAVWDSSGSAWVSVSPTSLWGGGIGSVPSIFQDATNWYLQSRSGDDNPYFLVIPKTNAEAAEQYEGASSGYQFGFQVDSIGVNTLAIQAPDTKGWWLNNHAN